MSNPTGKNQYNSAGHKAKEKAIKSGINLGKDSPLRAMANRMIRDNKERLGMKQAYVGSLMNLPKPPKPKKASDSLSANLGRMARGSGLTAQEQKIRAKVRGW